MMYHNLSSDELLQIFRTGITQSAKGLKKAAEAWVALRDRSYDMRSLQGPFTHYFPAIASGKLLPEVILTFGGSITLVGLVADLVPEEQKALVKAGATIPVLKPNGEVVEATPTELPVATARQVFGGGAIRTPEQQRAHLPASFPSARPAEPVLPPRPFVVPKLPAGTSLGEAMRSAGYEPPEARALQIAVDAWTKYPAAPAAGARRNFVRSRLQGEVTWALLTNFKASVLVEAVGWLLSAAEQSIREQAAAQRKTAGGGMRGSR
jgi:hypothetical protein